MTKTLDHRRSVTQLALRRAGIPVVESDRPDGGRAPSIVALDRRIGRLVRFHCGLRSPGRRPVRDLDGLRTAGTTSPATRSRRRPRRFDVHGVPAARRAGRTGVSGFSARRRAGRFDVHGVSARRRTGAFFAPASISVYPRCRRVSVNSAPGTRIDRRAWLFCLKRRFRPIPVGCRGCTRRVHHRGGASRVGDVPSWEYNPRYTRYTFSDDRHRQRHLSQNVQRMSLSVNLRGPPLRSGTKPPQSQ